MATFGKRRIAQQEEIDLLTGGTTLRMAFVFGLLGLVAALALAPALNSGTINLASLTGAETNQIDTTVTGSVEQSSTKIELPSGTKRYIVRRSVLQSNPAEPCYIFENGTQQGNC